MSDDVLAVKVTPDGRLLALSLLDSTVQVGALAFLHPHHKSENSFYGFQSVECTEELELKILKYYLAQNLKSLC